MALTIFVDLQMIKLSATTIKYPEIAERADEFAEILMNALDPKNRGYVEVSNFNLQNGNKQKRIR